MTLDEKTRLLYGVARPLGVHSVGYVPGVPRLGIPELLLSDGPVGLNDSCYGEQVPGNCRLGAATALPATVALAASFDTALATEYGRLVGNEARARGVDVLYGPAMNIVRIPNGGRNFEYFSEDPYLTGLMATAWTKALQRRGVAAQAKHFALNNQETARHTASSDADERTVREIYLSAWERVLDEGDAASIMCANNPVNGTYACEHTALLQQILGEWDWDGVVGSDYGATMSALGSVNAGLDHSFNGRRWGLWYDQLSALVRRGDLSEQVVDLRVQRILRMMIRLGMLDHNQTIGSVDVEAGGELSREVAERGTVLLKNDDGLLPLDPEVRRTVAVIGPSAEHAVTGGGGSSQVIPYYSVSPVEGISRRLGETGTVTSSDGADPAAAADLAHDADVAVVIVNDTSREGVDRSDIDLPGTQNQLVEDVQAANPRTIVVLNTGSATAMPWIDRVHTVLQMWYPGQENGNALAALLFGDTDPTGRLPITLPTEVSQSCCSTPPRYPAENGHYVYSEGLEVGYRWYDAQQREPLFPFGFGLSYTTFAMDQLAVTPARVDPAHGAAVRVRVTNTGARAGTAVRQVYLGFPVATGEPPRRLVAVDTIRLDPGESRTATMTIPPRAFAIWDTAAHNWDAIPATHTIWVGHSSRDLPLHTTVDIDDADGVTGIRVDSPSTVPAGAAFTLAVTATNTGPRSLADALLRLDAPTGWSVAAIGRRSSRRTAPPTPPIESRRRPDPGRGHTR